MRYNRNPFRSYCSAFIKSVMALSYVSGLMSFLYFFRYVNAMIAVDFAEVELTGCCTLKVSRISVL